MSKEYYVFGFNKKSRMSGFYSVPYNMIKKIKKGTVFFSENCGSISEVESMGNVQESIDIGNENDLIYYSGKVVGYNF